MLTESRFPSFNECACVHPRLILGPEVNDQTNSLVATMFKMFGWDSKPKGLLGIVKLTLLAMGKLCLKLFAFKPLELKGRLIWLLNLIEKGHGV